jgi:hypothetical protein
MRGRDGTSLASRTLGTVQQLLQESFDPIIDANVNVDLLPRMVYAQVGHVLWLRAAAAAAPAPAPGTCCILSIASAICTTCAPGAGQPSLMPQATAPATASSLALVHASAPTLPDHAIPRCPPSLQPCGEWDYSGMYSVLLRYQGKPVCAALFRCFGQQLAELPLIATRWAARCTACRWSGLRAACACLVS